MTDFELVSVAVSCGNGFCTRKCPFYDGDVSTCQQKFIAMLAEKLDIVLHKKDGREKPVCMPGDKVYQFSNGAVYENTVKNIIYDCGHIAFEEAAIGKHVFLTKEEAEKAGGENEN